MTTKVSNSEVRNRRTDLLHQISHRLTAKAGVLKVKTLNVRGMARNHHLALSVADAGMSRLVTFCRYKADWRGRQMVDIDRWFPGSQTCCMCGEIHREMKNLSRDQMICDCGNRMGRDRNASVNHYNYGTPRNCAEPAAERPPTCVEIGDQVGGASCLPVPVVEAQIPNSRSP